MSAEVLFPCGLVLILMAASCVAEAEPETVCEEAQLRFQRCGVTVPLLAEDDCSAAPKAISECVLKVSEGCNDLSTALVQLDQCVDDLDEDLAPLAPGGDI